MASFDGIPMTSDDDARVDPFRMGKLKLGYTSVLNSCAQSGEEFFVITVHNRPQSTDRAADQLNGLLRTQMRANPDCRKAMNLRMSISYSSLQRVLVYAPS